VDSVPDALLLRKSGNAGNHSSLTDSGHGVFFSSGDAASYVTLIMMYHRLQRLDRTTENLLYNSPCIPKPRLEPSTWRIQARSHLAPQLSCCLISGPSAGTPQGPVVPTERGSACSQRTSIQPSLPGNIPTTICTQLYAFVPVSYC
jgi:hypothetical protein